MIERRPIRLGVLGAARVAPMALLAPSSNRSDIEVVAIGARDGARARTLADEYQVANVYSNYDDVLDDEQVDAVYIPLPPSLNGAWTLRALAAGKHVLVEKPMAANAEEAQQVAAAAKDASRVVLQGYHYRYHPLIARARELLQRGAVGELVRVDARFEVKRPPEWNIRWRYELGGGTMMDHGSYPVHLARTLIEKEPTVTSAVAVPQEEPRNDAVMDAELDFGEGVSAGVHASMLGDRLSIDARVVGSDGVLELGNFIHAAMGGRIRLERAHVVELDESYEDSRSSFEFQLDAFVKAVRDGAASPTDSIDGIANLQVIDSVYRAAGLPLREPVHSLESEGH